LKTHYIAHNENEEGNVKYVGGISRIRDESWAQHKRGFCCCRKYYKTSYTLQNLEKKWLTL